MIEKTIGQIKVNKIFAHPNNPRTDLGDTTEITESMKINGVLQNLTVVPHDTISDSYTVIIGHRRLHAAKEAGLETVPAMVVELSKAEQQGMMLVENIQRDDLTPYEQAKGMQMCLDLGLSEDDIVEKTGFHKSTVRRRIKMLELDQDKVKEAKNATLEEYAMLDDIEDLDMKNEMLQYIGTSEFERRVEGEVRDQEKRKLRSELIDFLDSKGITELESDYRKHTEVLYNYNMTKEFVDKVKAYDFDDGPYYYENSYQFVIFKERPEEDDTPTEEEIKSKELEKEVKAKKAEVNKILELERNLRKNIVEDYLHSEISLTEKQRTLIQNEFIIGYFNGGYFNGRDNKALEQYGVEDFFNLVGEHSWNKVHVLKKTSEAMLKRSFHEFLLASMQIRLDAKDEITYLKHSYTKLLHEENKELSSFVKFFTDAEFGYTPSEEFTQLLDGTHAIYDEDDQDE